ncbi:MAG: HRDC domain-containing protein, partial [Proteobacteria bacterium]|nr:HRDC domain-containing protein [Pseudomonadota bacterium]
KKAEKLNIDPGLLLNKALITAIGIDNPGSFSELEQISGMKNWQRSELGEEIISILKKEK